MTRSAEMGEHYQCSAKLAQWEKHNDTDYSVCTMYKKKAVGERQILNQTSGEGIISAALLRHISYLELELEQRSPCLFVCPQCHMIVDRPVETAVTTWFVRCTSASGCCILANRVAQCVRRDLQLRLTSSQHLQ